MIFDWLMSKRIPNPFTLNFMISYYCYYYSTLQNCAKSNETKPNQIIMQNCNEFQFIELVVVKIQVFFISIDSNTPFKRSQIQHIHLRFIHDHGFCFSSLLCNEKFQKTKLIFLKQCKIGLLKKKKINKTCECYKPQPILKCSNISCIVSLGCDFWQPSKYCIMCKCI